MNKVTIVLGSFIVGACSVVLLLSGSQMSIIAQPSSQRGFVIGGAEPVVPPLSGNVVSKLKVINLIQPLDGLNCSDCIFENVTLEYSGGATRLVNPKFFGRIKLEFKGAAANTVALLRFLAAIEAQRKPKVLPPNAPIMKLAVIKEPISADLISPYGQK